MPFFSRFNQPRFLSFETAGAGSQTGLKASSSPERLNGQIAQEGVVRGPRPCSWQSPLAPANWFAALLLLVSAAGGFAEEAPGPTRLFNGKDLDGWKAADMSYWTVEEDSIVGTKGEETIRGNQFLWHDVTVKDFYLTLMIRQSPYESNAGIQFRSRARGRGAHGYQADVGHRGWGKLYHEHGRKVLEFPRIPIEEFVKSEEWNRYEILAVGDRLWMAVNGKITVALRDPLGESEGRIALQIHGGIPQRVLYKEIELTHDPKVNFVGKSEAELNALLKDAPEMGIKTPRTGPLPLSVPRPAASPKNDGSNDKKSEEKPTTTKSTSAGPAATELTTTELTTTGPASGKATPAESTSTESSSAELAPPASPFTNGLRAPTRSRPATPPAFDLAQDDVVVFLGGTDVVMMDEYGYLETWLTSKYAARKPHFRNMAWEGDTVFRQFRPRAFHLKESPYKQPDQRQKLQADVIFLQLGKMDSVDPEHTATDFEKELEKLVAHLQRFAPRVVLLTPAPFPNRSSVHAARSRQEVLSRNGRLAKEYVPAIERVGQRKGCLVVDVFGGMMKRTNPAAAQPLRQSIMLDQEAHLQMAQVVAEGLGISPRQEEGFEDLRRAIVRKNKLWFEYWRPTNWSFLYGRRQNVPSSYRHDQRRVRWFPEEVEAVLPHLRAAEEKIFQMTGAGAHESAPKQ